MINKWKNNINDKFYNIMVLFIDFKKAFDLINPNLFLLFLKLFQNEFDNKALGLFKDYFKNRLQ